MRRSWIVIVPSMDTPAVTEVAHGIDPEENERLELEALEAKETSRKQGSRKGGKADKKCRAIAEVVKKKFARNRYPASKVFRTFPPSEAPEIVHLPEGDYEVYRDGDDIVQVDPSGHERTVNARTLAENYVAEARKKSRRK